MLNFVARVNSMSLKLCHRTSQNMSLF